jgi:UDP-glucose 4-epimerase
MRILVTGGAGYIGSVVIQQLVEAGDQVVVYDSLVRGHRRAIHPDATFVEGDIADRARVEQTLADHQIEAVMHFAALIEAGESMKTPAAYFRNITAGSLSLFEAVLARGIDKVVFSSTAAVYGNPAQLPIDEDALLQPTNVYGQAKLMVEQMLRWFSQTLGLRYAALRYFNACGAAPPLGEDHQPESHLIPLAMQAVLGQRPALQLYGTDYPTRDGTCIRDYIHVSDLASAHLLALRALAAGRGPLVYNLGSERGYTNREVIDAVGRVAGRPVPVVDAPRRAGDPDALVASSARIRRELGWQPRYTDLDSMVQTAWDWRQQHPNGYGDR